jgi:NhaP-type Na+/H+ or K+/H+ antiporter
VVLIVALAVVVLAVVVLAGAALGYPLGVPPPILLLAVGVAASYLPAALGVAVVVRALMDIPRSVAIAIGAVAAPPDAVSATAIGRRIGLPRRPLTVGLARSVRGLSWETGSYVVFYSLHHHD